MCFLESFAGLRSLSSDEAEASQMSLVPQPACQMILKKLKQILDLTREHLPKFQGSGVRTEPSYTTGGGQSLRRVKVFREHVTEIG